MLGTSHSFQLSGNRAASEFRGFVEGICDACNPAAIAEELSVESLVQKHAGSSVGMEIASELGIAHILCDPDSGERSLLGIRGENEIRIDEFHADSTPDQIEAAVRESHSRRERIWLQRIANAGLWPVIFICGANHILNFCALLRTEGLKVEISASDWIPRQAF